jgi:hypothetical protein
MIGPPCSGDHSGRPTASLRSTRYMASIRRNGGRYTYTNRNGIPNNRTTSDFVTSMGGTLVRTIGIAGARTKIGMTNLAYDMKRYVWLERLAIEVAR